MSVSVPSPAVHTARLRLALTSALTSVVAGALAGPASAQTLPVPRLPTRADVVDTSPDGLLTSPVVTSANGRLDVVLRTRNTVIDWNGFNIPENDRADFTDGRPLATGSAAVLNRDVSGNVSQLLGRLTSSSNVEVWVYNPNGIMVGAKAAFATGSLVLTTLDPSETDFLAGGGDYRLTALPTAGQSVITVLNGAQIRVEGGNRGLVMVAPKIDAEGRFEAVGQDVAFVTAADVTLSYANNGPLSVTLRQGTAVPGRSQYVRGSVAGNSALFALASQGTITDALLRVDASVTTAAAGARGIVLSAGRPATVVAGVAVSAAPADTGGIAALQVAGMLTSTDTSSSDIRAAASGTATFTGSLSSGRDILVSAGGALDVAGAVTAVGAVDLAGRSIGLGPANAAAPDLLQSAGSIGITTTGGDIVGRSGLTLATSGAGAVTLATGGTTAGNIAFAADTLVQAGVDRGGILTVRVRDPGNAVMLGDVSARALRGAVGTGAAANGLTLGAALTVGDVDVRDALVLNGGGIVAGRVASDAAVTVVSTATLSADAVAARGGSATLAGSHGVTVAGTVTAQGTNADVMIDGAGAISLTGLTAARDVRVGSASSATSATITGPVGAGRAYSIAAGTVNLGSAAAVTQSANGAVTITAGVGGITATGTLTVRSNADGLGAEALTLAIDPAAAGSGGGAIVFGSGTTLAGGTTQQSDVQLRSADAAGTVTLGRISARALLGAVGTDAFATGLTRSGAIGVGAVALRGDLLLAGGAIDTGALSSGGAVMLDGGTGAVAVGDVDAAGGISVSGGALSLRGARLAAGGAIDLRARTGGIDSSGALAIGSTSTRTTDFVRLQAAGPQGIVLAPGSTIAAGTDRSLRVAVFNGTTDAPLALGTVAARSLGGLAMQDGDATRPAGVIVGGTLNFGELNLIDSFAAQSTSGDLSIVRLAVTGAGQGISLRAARALRVPDTLSASGDVTLASGADLRLATVESRDGRASVTGGGDVRLTLLSGALGASAQGTALTIDTVRGGTVSLVTTAGDATIGTIVGSDVAANAAGTLRLASIDATRAVTLAVGSDLIASGLVRTSGGGIGVSAATGSVRLAGGTQASSDIAVTARAVTVGGVQQAGGAYTARATDGSIAGLPGLAITADADALGGEALTLAATGDVLLGDDASLRGGRDGGSAVTITAGGAVVTGAVTGARLVVAGTNGPLRTIRTGALTVGSDVVMTASGGVTTGAISAGTGGVAISGGGGETNTGDVTAAGDVTLSGSTVTFGAVNAGSLSASAGTGDLTSGAVTVTGAASIGGTGVVRTGPIMAGGAVMLTGGTLSIGGVTGASLTARAASGAVIGSGVTVSGAVGVTAATTIELGAVTTTRGTVTLDSGGRMVLAGVTAGGGANLTTRGTGADIVLVNGLSAVDPVMVAATGSIRAPFIRSSAGDLTISAPAGEVSGVDPTSAIALSAGAGHALSLTVGTAARLGDIAAGRLSVSATSISAGRVDAGTGTVTLRATKGDLLVSGLVTGGAVTLSATERTVLANVTASGALVLNGGTALSFGEVGGASIAGVSGGAIAGTAARTGGALDLAGTALSLRDAGGQAVSLRAADGDLALGTLTTIEDAALTASGAARVSGTAAIGGAYRVTGATVALGGGEVSQRANGAVRITATTGDITGAAGLTLASDADGTGAEALILDAAGGITLAGTRLQARLGGGAVLGVRAGSGRTVQLGLIEADTLGSFDGSGVARTFTHNADVSTGDLTATDLGVALSAGNLVTGKVTTGGPLSLRATAGTITAGDVSSAGVDLSSAGALTVGTIDARGAATLAGRSITVGDTSATSLAIRTAGALGGQGGTRPSLTTTTGDLAVEAGAIRLRVVSSAGSAALSGSTVDVAGQLTAARSLLVQAREALTAHDMSAGADMTVRSDGSITTGSLEASGTLTATGAGVLIAAAQTGGQLALTSTRDLTLGSGTATGAIAIDAAGLATLGSLSGGPAITLTAADAALSGPVRATSVTFANKVPATGALRLGDGAGDDGFRLSAVEIGQVAADIARFDAGAGMLVVGTLALAPATGRVVDMVSTGAVRVVGGLSATGEGRTIRLGGGADANAATINIVATSAAGGRLLLDGNDLQLRADRIAVGLGPGFIDTLVAGEAGRTQAVVLIGSANSALYNPQLGGGFYEPGATTLVQARSLTVRFADYALFQNTGLPGQSSGVTIGGTPGAPVMPALRVTTSGAPAKASFALFGTVNGIGGTSAALLGAPVLDIDPTLLANSRINGCLAGSGAGCLTTIVIQPALQVFDFESEDVFGISQDVAVPFAPVVGGNNEELLGDLPELLPQGELGGVGATPAVPAPPAEVRP